MITEQWLNERKKGIGGSDAAAICGLSPYRTPLQVWEDKRGLAGPIPDNDAMFWGRTLEPVIRQRYSDKTGRSVLLPTEILHHDKHDFMLANIDGFTPDHRGVEVKTTAYPTGWGEEGTDEIPVGYIFQVQHYMIVTGFPVFDVPVLIGGRDFRIYEVQAEEELQGMLVDKEREFWEMVVNGIPPDPMNFEDVKRLYRRSEANEITASAEVEVWVEGLRKIREDLKTLETNEEEIKFRIMEAMKESDTLINLKGNVLATWRASKPAVRFDLDRFKQEHPTTFSLYQKETEPTRRFLIKK